MKKVKIVILTSSVIAFFVTALVFGGITWLTTGSFAYSWRIGLLFGFVIGALYFIFLYIEFK